MILRQNQKNNLSTVADEPCYLCDIRSCLELTHRKVLCMCRPYKTCTDLLSDKMVACDMFMTVVLLWFQVDCEMYIHKVNNLYIFTLLV